VADQARDNEVLAVTPVTVEGILSVGKNEYILHYRLKTIVTVPSARSLEPFLKNLVLLLYSGAIRQSTISLFITSKQQSILYKH
jgi:uncharacterized metal-binding protein YceD (DUF177 family)